MVPALIKAPTPIYSELASNVPGSRLHPAITGTVFWNPWTFSGCIRTARSGRSPGVCSFPRNPSGNLWESVGSEVYGYFWFSLSLGCFHISLRFMDFIWFYRFCRIPWEPQQFTTFHVCFLVSSGDAKNLGKRPSSTGAGMHAMRPSAANAGGALWHKEPPSVGI